MENSKELQSFSKKRIIANISFWTFLILVIITFITSLVIGSGAWVSVSIMFISFLFMEFSYNIKKEFDTKIEKLTVKTLEE